MRRFFLFKLNFIIIFQIILLDKVYSDNKLSYIYSDRSINFVSARQVNAIEFCVPIVQVNSPPGQLASVFDGDGRTVSYVNHNKTMLFYLSNKAQAIQFMVTLKNGRVLSLHFVGDKLMGRVVRVPVEISGDSIHRNKKIHQSYDVKIERIMRSAFFGNMGNEWVKIRESVMRGYKNININKYTEWDNIFYKIGVWDFCSNSKNTLLVDYKKINGKNKILASTLTHKKLAPYGCAKLILLYEKDNSRAV